MSKEIAIVIGYNAAGKSTLVREFEQDGYHRINRDLTGGTIEAQVELARKALTTHDRVVLDNTYPTIESRESIVALGQQMGIPVRCVWLTTSFEDAQLNACLRMMEQRDQLLMPEDFKKEKSPNLFPPVALFTYKNKFENKKGEQKHPGKQDPKKEHGFFVVEKRPFVRQWPAEFCNKALLLDYDDTLRRSKGDKNWPEKPEDVEILPNRKEVLDEYVANGWRLLGVSNQSAIAKGLKREDAVACFERTNELLGHDIEYMFCPHQVPPVNCYCRKPHPGMGAHFIWKYKLLPSACIMVGDQTSDKTFASRCGFVYKEAEEFFAL